MKKSFYFLLLVGTLFLACGKDKKDTFSSPKDLYVDHIVSHTSGVVSSQSLVKVKLTKKQDNIEIGKKTNPVRAITKVKPEVKTV